MIRLHSPKSIGRVAGTLMLTQFVVAPLTAFVLLGRLSAPPGLLANAAGSAMQVRVAVLLWFVAGALSLAIAIVTLPLFRQYSERMALLYLALSAVSLATVAAENVALLNLLSLSQEYTKTGAATELLETLGTAARSARAAAHYSNILVGGIAVFVFDLVLFRFALVPRAVAAIALAAAPLQTAAVTVALLGNRFPTRILIPVAAAHFALILWLVAMGFNERRAPGG